MIVCFQNHLWSVPIDRLTFSSRDGAMGTLATWQIKRETRGDYVRRQLILSIYYTFFNTRYRIHGYHKARIETMEYKVLSRSVFQ